MQFSWGSSCQKYRQLCFAFLPFRNMVTCLHLEFTHLHSVRYAIRIHKHWNKHLSLAALSLAIDHSVPLLKAESHEPATFPFVAQYLNHCATAAPEVARVRAIK
jgi:hypothetical protein